MADRLDLRNRLAAQDTDRGSMLLVTARQRMLLTLACEVCGARHSGGKARGVLLEEPGADTPWLLWVLCDGWSFADHSEVVVCSDHQANKLLRILRFAE
jgi:hypothetical protein